jgi:subtilisin family serine protease
MRRFLARVGVLIVLGSLAVAPSAFAQDEVKVTSGWRNAPGPGQTLLVTFDDTPDRPTAAGRLTGLGRVRETLPEAGIWELSPGDAATAQAQAITRAHVVHAEWTHRHRTAVLTDPRPTPPPALPLNALPEPTDPYYAVPGQFQQWSLRRGNWAIGLSSYDRPTIAILDSGLDQTHEDWRTPGIVVAPYAAASGLSDAGQVPDIAFNGHGTHVAGIAAAPANGVGVVGVAPASPTPADPTRSKVLPVRIAYNSLGDSNDAGMIAGIRWAVEHGAKVINISSGGPEPTNAFQDTINWAYKRGALIIASVGNEGVPNPDDPDSFNLVNFPAGYDHVLGVGALCDGNASLPYCPDPFGRARFSNFNYTVDVMAPGVNIVSTIPLSVHEGEVAPGYGVKDGTSMAAPYVAGVAALIYASHPGITPYQVTRILQQTASTGAAGGARSSTFGWGVVNPLAAVQAQAPVDDLAEPNDDIKWLPKRDTFRVTTTPTRLRARMDFNDDQFDTYGVVLRKGERMRVTIAAKHASIGVTAYRPGPQSVLLRGLAQREFVARRAYLTRKRLGFVRRPSPGTHSFVVRAKETGRHFIALEALKGGGDYTLVISRV